MERLIGRLAAMLARCGRGALRLQCRLSISAAMDSPRAKPRWRLDGRPVRGRRPGRSICSPWSNCNWSAAAAGAGAGDVGRGHAHGPLGVPAAGIVSRRLAPLATAAPGRPGRAAQQPAGRRRPWCGRACGRRPSRNWPAAMSRWWIVAGVAATRSREAGRSCRRGLCGCCRRGRHFDCARRPAGTVPIFVVGTRSVVATKMGLTAGPAAADRPLLGTGADRDRLVARPAGRPRLLPGGDGGRPPFLALSPPPRRTMVLARNV